ncbi:hypothetical protein PY650_31030 [Rhizobium calliandrae]|uniref:Abortive infection protein-like C-terminal domain-containing protein n=1 Tax=Rhizobium calliandrae TaxID=1312182 RepID=A0ABT7KMY2_9HYPH|nr:hypothetical protein [Rhizobium calliandrae]MDL2409974.1 hypothetical protein [Rhizobium calliandrae]
MAAVLPSQIVVAIEYMFGSARNELDGNGVRHSYQNEVRCLLELLESVPRDLIALPFNEYVELTRCRAALSAAVAKWAIGDISPAYAVMGKDAVERIRLLMSKCGDEVPPKEPILAFIAEDGIRTPIEDKIRAAWTDFSANEWMGATVFAGAALEGMLHWALKDRVNDVNGIRLAKMIEEARKYDLIGEEAKQQAKLAKDARNLIHPGRTDRSGNTCTRATALTAFAAVYRVSDDLKRYFGRQAS